MKPFRNVFTSELNGLIRDLHSELDQVIVPFQLAIAAGDRSKAIALQHHVDLIGAAMVVVYEKMLLSVSGRENHSSGPVTHRARLDAL